MESRHFLSMDVSVVLVSKAVGEANYFTLKSRLAIARVITFS